MIAGTVRPNYFISRIMIMPAPIHKTSHTHTHTAHMFGLNGKCGFGMRRRRARLSFRAAHGKRRRRRRCGLLRQRHRQLESTRRRSEQTCNL